MILRGRARPLDPKPSPNPESTMPAITLTGTVTKCEMLRKTDPDYLGMRKYSPNTERYLYRLNICLEADGKRYFFDSPAYAMAVANCPVAAVVSYCAENKDADNWFRVSDGSGVCTVEKANTNELIPLVKVGDTITIRASVKAEKTTYTTLNRVKMATAVCVK
jgi:hypothetical protein